MLFILHFKRKYDGIQAFPEDATVLDPRFKFKMDRNWDRIRASAVPENTEAVEKVLEFDNAFSTFLLWELFFLLFGS